MNKPIETKFAIDGWCAIADGISTAQNWSLWAQDRLAMTRYLPQPDVSVIPGMMRRRIDKLGRCVMFTYLQCLPGLEKVEPAIITISRHGNVPLLHNLIDCCKQDLDLSPTTFACSVHNRLSSLVSMYSGYHGASGAYSSLYDGMALAIVEAAGRLADSSVERVLIIAYESEDIANDRGKVKNCCPPHAATFVLKKPDIQSPTYTLTRRRDSAKINNECGACLPLIRSIVNQGCQRDGHWEYRYHG